MPERPTYIDLQAKPVDPSSRLGLLSPRMQYNDGEIPPSLSPLDAFAAQSRRLALQLDQKTTGEKRMSRLSPAMVTKSLSQHRAERPAVFRSLSEESGGSQVKDEEYECNNPAIAHGQGQHLSQHLRISGVSITATEDTNVEEGVTTPMDRASTTSSIQEPRPQSDYFGLPRADSPAAVSGPADTTVVLGQTQMKAPTALTVSSSPSKQEGYLRDSSSNKQLDPYVPNPLTARRPIPHHESSDDDYSSSIADSSFSYPRKLSSSSGISAPHSPLSPFIPVHPPRSPSMNSEASVNGTSAPRVLFNFSRPRSAASLSFLSRADSPAPQKPANAHSRQTSLTPQGTSREPPKTDDGESTDNDGYLSGGGTSYTYARFSLPRGRMVSRDSTIFQGLSTPHFEWKEPLFQDNSFTSLLLDKPSSSASTSQPPPVTPDTKSNGSEQNRIDFTFDFEPAQPRTPKKPVERQALIPSSQPFTSPKSAKSAVPLKSRPATGISDSRSIQGHSRPQTAAENAESIPFISNARIGPVPTKTGASYAAGLTYLSPDDHVTKAIDCHEKGSLQESTYHLRIGAMQNHPTAMLLYALACRHGWGMRPNQREGLQWLRKALDTATLEIAEDEDPNAEAGLREFNDKKTRRAQFALSVYELGVSHLKGWGTEQDKALALRCFEVAGHWGDVDALTEAGFCYAEGIGCRRNLKKAAKLYRMAEAQGVSMVGNSWIYKDKYNDDNEIGRSRSPARTPTTTESKTPRDKSRTRSIFGRKKSYQAVPS